MSYPVVGFSIPIYNRFDHLKVLLSSLMVQTDPNWIATVVKDGPYTNGEIEIIMNYKDNRISFIHKPNRTNNWGHTPRQMGKQLLAPHCDYVVMTGDDNYYVPTFVSELQILAPQAPGMIYWDMVHSHYNYQHFISSLGFNQIDIGAFATRSDIASQIALPTSYAADGEFVEIYKKLYPNELNLKIEKTLYVHN